MTAGRDACLRAVSAPATDRWRWPRRRSPARRGGARSVARVAHRPRRRGEGGTRGPTVLLSLGSSTASPETQGMTDIILITGANKGLGFETARRLSELGHTVLLGARDAERGQD